MNIRIEPLSKKHNRKGFRCGELALDKWFETQAGQDERRHFSRVFVAIDDDGVVGFYSLSMFALALDDLPTTLSRKLPNYQAIPAALIGRLARHERTRGCGVGELLVADAIARILNAAVTVAAYAIVVDAKNEHAISFYESFGFVLFPTAKNRLFLLCDTARKALNK
jgi:ribosomal protein S18 acetylase RimI-like enzyme